jgi:Protein of unknown function (DUF1367)
MEIVVAKHASGILVPVDSDAVEYLASRKIGEGFKVKITSFRNYLFHKKFFCLLNFAFDAWEPREITFKGMIASKEREKFREDITILAGYWYAVVDIHGNVKAKAKSISFANMEQEEFERLYSAVIDVVLRKVLSNYTRDDLKNTINQLLSYT